MICTLPARFNAIKRRLGGIPHNELTQALRRLERNSLVSRRVITASPVAVEYSITPLGCTLQQPFAALYTWAVEHVPDIQRAQVAFDRRASSEERADRAGSRAMAGLAVVRRGVAAHHDGESRSEQ